MIFDYDSARLVVGYQADGQTLETVSQLLRIKSGTMMAVITKLKETQNNWEKMLSQNRGGLSREELIFSKYHQHLLDGDFYTLPPSGIEQYRKIKVYYQFPPGREGPTGVFGIELAAAKSDQSAITTLEMSVLTVKAEQIKTNLREFAEQYKLSTIFNQPEVCLILGCS